MRALVDFLVAVWKSLFHTQKVVRLQTAFDLSDDQNDALSKIFDSQNQIVFLCGPAGTGKSFLIQKIRERTLTFVPVMAPTGVAAQNVSGVTIHRFFGFPAKLLPPTYSPSLLNEDKRTILRDTRLLIFDEASMIRADLVDAVDRSMRANLGIDKPFGGKRILFVGDPLQLEPVLTREESTAYHQHWRSTYFFRADVFRNIQINRAQLKTVHRQADDTEFALALMKLRTTDTLAESVERLSGLVRVAELPKDALILCPRNSQADSFNELKFQELKSRPITYHGRVQGDFPESDRKTTLLLTLKVGARVMFVANEPGDSPRFINGTMAIVTRLDENRIQVRTDDGQFIFVDQFTWKKIDYGRDEDGETVSIEVGSFRQYPLKLAWAVTVHKAQGLTLNKVHIDPGNGFFASGHAYVALTRCKSSAGITLSRELTAHDFFWKPELMAFLDSFG